MPALSTPHSSESFTAQGMVILLRLKGLTEHKEENAGGMNKGSLYSTAA